MFVVDEAHSARVRLDTDGGLVLKLAEGPETVAAVTRRVLPRRFRSNR